MSAAPIQSFGGFAPIKSAAEGVGIDELRALAVSEEVLLPEDVGDLVRHPARATITAEHTMVGNSDELRIPSRNAKVPLGRAIENVLELAAQHQLLENNASAAGKLFGVLGHIRDLHNEIHHRSRR